MQRLIGSMPIAALLVACAGTPGAQPHDMSAAQHEAMGAQAEQGAALHQAQYDAGATETVERCGRGGRNFTHGGGGIEGPCWTSTRNPTAGHLDEASKLRKVAADHRAASQALRDAEALSCVGLSDDDRDISPFAHGEDIASVEPLYANVMSGKGPSSRLQGAVITFRALPGMTAQWLQRVVDCHLARNAALGHQVPEMPYCPLVPKGVTATVTPAGAGFAVGVRSDDTETANDVLRRAQSLVGK
jgi:hypothetical protein